MKGGDLIYLMKIAKTMASMLKEIKARKNNT